MENKDIKDNCLLKTSMYLLNVSFNIFNKFKDNDRITTILTCSDSKNLY